MFVQITIHLMCIVGTVKVVVFGIGGVGSFVCEALARCGVGNFVLVDNDTVDITNINRQLIALKSILGKFKVDVMEDKIKNIYDIEDRKSVV